MYNVHAFHTKVSSEFKKVGIEFEFEIKESKIKAPDVIISMAAFRMPDPYKDETLYKNGLSYSFSLFDKYFPNSILRVYYDDSVIKKNDEWLYLLDEAESLPFVELVKFSCSQFKNGDYHSGLFGTIVRFLPLFNFIDNKILVSIMDIDNDNEGTQKAYTDIKKGVELIKKHKVPFLGCAYGLTAYYKKSRLELSNITEKYGFYTRIVAPQTLCIKKLNKKLIVDFIRCIYDKCSSYQEWLDITIKGLTNTKNPKTIHTLQSVQNIKQAPHGVVIFGIDELFLNNDILSSYLKSKQPFILLKQSPSMVHFHYYLFMMFKERRAPFFIMNNLYKHILGKTSMNVKDIYNNFNTVDKCIYKLEFVNGLKYKKILTDKNALDLYHKIYEFVKSNLSEIMTSCNMLRHEVDIFLELRDKKFEEFDIDYRFYLVKSKKNKQYEYIKLD